MNRSSVNGCLQHDEFLRGYCNKLSPNPILLLDLICHVWENYKVTLQKLSIILEINGQLLPELIANNVFPMASAQSFNICCFNADYVIVKKV